MTQTTDVEQLRIELRERVVEHPVRLWPPRLLRSVSALIDVFFAHEHRDDLDIIISGRRHLRIVPDATTPTVVT